jgi:protein kinase C substrate 80K-H
VRLETESTQARKAYDDAEYSLKLTREEKQRAEEDYAELFDVDGYGREGEWKKLEGTCLEVDTGEYVSFICSGFLLYTAVSFDGLPTPFMCDNSGQN